VKIIIVKPLKGKKKAGDKRGNNEVNSLGKKEERDSNKAQNQRGGGRRWVYGGGKVGALQGG